MHKEILTKEQIKLLPLVAEFSKDFGLVGGTAVAFHLGHRRSIDFDLFSKKGIIKIPDLLTLAAMKAFALGQRNKWKDYIDLYFIIKNHFSISEISERGKQLFGSNFNEKLFRGQLAYFEGINYKEPVEFLPGFEVDDDTVKKKLVEFSLQ